MVFMANQNSYQIEGIPLGEGDVSIDFLAEFTHSNFHSTIEALKADNTLDKILRLFIGEIDELLEYLEKEPGDRVNAVAETGDLFHFWGDLLKLGDFQAYLLTKLDISSLKRLAIKKHEHEMNAINLLYSLKGMCYMIEDGDFNGEFLQIILLNILAVAVILDVNVIYATLMKNLRNRKKYDPELMNKMWEQAMTYEEITSTRAKSWNNGDEEFFEEFMRDFPIELSYAAASQLAADTN